MTVLEHFMRQGRDATFLEQVMYQQFRLGPNGVRHLTQQVYERWAYEAQRAFPHERPRQVQNINAFIATLTTDADGNRVPGEMLAKRSISIVNAMGLLSKLTGTQAPLRVDLSTSQAQALGAVMAGQTKEQLEELAAEYDRGQRAIAQLEDGTQVLDKPSAALRVVKDGG